MSTSMELVFPDEETVDAKQTEKAKKEIEQTTALLKNAQEIPSVEIVARSMSTGERAKKAAQDLVVNSPETYKQALDLGLACSAAIKSVKKPKPDNVAMLKLQEGLEGARRLHKWFTDLVSSLTTPFAEAQDIADRKALTYKREQDRIAAEESARLTREAEKKAEDARLAKATELAESGNSEEADAVLERPVFVQPVVVQSAASVSVAGASSRKRWKAKCTDLMKLAKAVAEGRVPLHFILANDSALNAEAKAREGTFAIDGCIAFDEGTMVHKEK